MSRHRSRAPRRRGNDRGAVFVMVAGSLTVLILLAGLAVDLGQQRFARRDAQANADVIALDMARIANGRPMTAISAIPGVEAGPEQLAASLDRNGFDVAPGNIKKGVNDGALVATSSDGREIHVQWGWLSDLPMLPSDPNATCSVGQQEQIRPDGPWWMDCRQGNSIPNAAKVTIYDDVDFLFLPAGGGADGGSVARTAYARHGGIPTAAFSVGSFGVSVLDAGFLNSLLTSVLGDSVGLDVLHYEGLANASITITELLGLIDHPDLDVPLSTLTPHEALATAISLGDLWVATAEALVNRGDTLNAGVLQDLIDLGLPSTDLTLGDLLDLSSPGEDSGLRTGLDVLSIIGATAFLSQCPADVSYDDPSADPAECSAINVPGVNVGLPGLADVGADLQVIQAPIVVAGPVGASGQTGQIKLGLGGDLGTTQLPCTPAIQLLCVGNLLALDVGLDADIHVAGGPNTIREILCSVPAHDRLTVESITNLLDIDLTLTLDFEVAAKVLLVTIPVLGVNVEISGGTREDPRGGNVMFDVPPDVLGETVRGTGMGDLGLSGLDLSVDVNTSILGGLGLIDLLLNSLLDLVTGPILEGFLLNALVNPLLSTLDTLLLGPLFDLLGVNVVGSDLTPLAIDCNASGVQLVG